MLFPSQKYTQEIHLVAIQTFLSYIFEITPKPQHS